MLSLTLILSQSVGAERRSSVNVTSVARLRSGVCELCSSRRGPTMPRILFIVMVGIKCGYLESSFTSLPNLCTLGKSHGLIQLSGFLFILLFRRRPLSSLFAEEVEIYVNEYESMEKNFSSHLLKTTFYE